MSEYYLADEKAKQRERQRAEQKPKEAQDVKITLLGDFLFASNEPKGFDPYNSSLGKTAQEAWKSPRTRR